MGALKVRQGLLTSPQCDSNQVFKDDDMMQGSAPSTAAARAG